MPSRVSVRINVLCEDSEHESFVRRLLTQELGIDRRRIDVEKAPKGEGAASDWVVRRYRDKVALDCRRARNQAGLGFLVMVDGDNAGFKNRIKALDGDERVPEERVALLAPTWSVETWVLWLLGEEVTEAGSVKERLRPAEFHARLQDAISRWRTPPQGKDLPSLAHARVELQRLP